VATRKIDRRNGTIDRPATSALGHGQKYRIVMKTGSWITIGVLLGILAASSWFAYQGLTTGQGVQISVHGYIAMALGIFFSLVVGVGLMTLVFYSSRAGYDAPHPRTDEPREKKDASS
jgi:hypothetical protein